MGDTPSLNGARVLIVEDEYLIADDMARAVCEAGGEAVGPVGTVPQAEELIGREAVDAAIVDLNLRGETASEFIGSLAAGDVACLIVSGYGGDAVPPSLSGIARLEKPVSPSSVMRELSRQIYRGTPALAR